MEIELIFKYKSEDEFVFITIQGEPKHVTESMDFFMTNPNYELTETYVRPQKRKPKTINTTSTHG